MPIEICSKSGAGRAGRAARCGVWGRWFGIELLRFFGAGRGIGRSGDLAGGGRHGADGRGRGRDRETDAFPCPFPVFTFSLPSPPFPFPLLPHSLSALSGERHDYLKASSCALEVVSQEPCEHLTIILEPRKKGVRCPSEPTTRSEGPCDGMHESPPHGVVQ